MYYSGTAEFVAEGEAVLGLNITQVHGEFTRDWHYVDVFALKMGPWSKS